MQYELYDACLARDPITALNKMGAPVTAVMSRSIAASGFGFLSRHLSVLRFFDFSDRCCRVPALRGAAHRACQYIVPER